MSDPRDDLAAELLVGMQAMQEANPWTFMDLTVDLEDDGRVWIETTSAIDLRELADQLLAAGYRKSAYQLASEEITKMEQHRAADKPHQA